MIDLTLEARLRLMVAVRWSVDAVAGGDGQTRPRGLAVRSRTPPSPALLKLVLAGIGSVTVTPVASALPMLLTLIV